MSVVNKTVPEARATKSAAHRVNLTDQVIRRSPALDKPYRIWDIKVPGLFVRIQPSGIRTFNVQWSRTRSASIGKFPHRTLEYARNKAHKVMADAQDHGVPEVAHAKSRPSTFTSFITDHYEPWVTAERKAGKATVANIKAQFGPLFDKKPLPDITAWAVEKFKATRLRAGIKPTTVNRDLDRLRACLTKAVDWKMLPANPISTVKRSKGGASNRVRYLGADEENRLRSALAAREEERRGHRSSGNAWAKARGRKPRHEWAPDEYTDHLAPLVLLAINTGLRRGELFGLTWKSIDIERRQCKVSAATAKSGRDRYIPLNTEALAVIKRLNLRADADGLVFPGTAGAALTHINRSWARLVKDARLDDFHFHDCRHHFASRLVMSGVDLYVVKELLGHSDFAMTQRYAHLSPEHKAAAVERLVAAR